MAHVGCRLNSNFKFQCLSPFVHLLKELIDLLTYMMICMPSSCYFASYVDLLTHWEMFVIGCDYFILLCIFAQIGTVIGIVNERGTPSSVSVTERGG